MPSSTPPKYRVTTTMRSVRPLCCSTSSAGVPAVLAGVGVALPVALPQAVGVNVVPRGAVGRAHLLQKGHGLFLAVCKRELRNEAALLLLIFADGCAPDGAVILHADSSCLLCSLQNSIP